MIPRSPLQPYLQVARQAGPSEATGRPGQEDEAFELSPVKPDWVVFDQALRPRDAPILVAARPVEAPSAWQHLVGLVSASQKRENEAARQLLEDLQPPQRQALAGFRAALAAAYGQPVADEAGRSLGRECLRVRDIQVVVAHANRLQAARVAVPAPVPAATPRPVDGG